MRPQAFLSGHHLVFLAKKVLLQSKDYDMLPEFKPLVTQSKAATKVCIGEFKTLVDNGCRAKTREAFDPFLFSKGHVVFWAASRLLDAGFFDEDGKNFEVPCLKAVVCMQGDIDKLLTTPSEVVEAMSERDVFDFHKQLMSATWFKEELTKYIDNKEWVDAKNSQLKQAMPKLVSVGGLTSKLQAKLTPQLKEVADKYKSLFPEGESSPGVAIEHVASEAAKKNEDWINFVGAKDL